MAGTAKEEKEVGTKKRKSQLRPLPKGCEAPEKEGRQRTPILSPMKNPLHPCPL